MTAETSQTLGRGLRVLEVLAATPSGLTITALAAQVGVNRTVVYRLVATLEVHGLARRDAAGLVHVGLGVLALARGLQPVLRELAAPVLRALAEELGMTAHLTVADGGEALAIAVVEPTWTDFHVGYRVGARHPLGQGAAGRAILLGRERPDAPAAAGNGYVETAGEIQAGARVSRRRCSASTASRPRSGSSRWATSTPSAVGPLVVSAAARVASRLA